MYINRVSASDWDYETTDTTINAGNWYRWSGTMTSGTVLSGFFETSKNTEGIDFLICDDTNYNLYSTGQSANVYSLKENMHYASYSFTLPYDDDWYVVFSNRDGSSSVTVDMALDRDGDNSPYFSSLIWDNVVNGEVLENDQWYYFSLTCVEGTTIDVSFKTWFSSDGVDGFICDSANYNLWSIGQSASVWNKKDDMNIASLTTFVTPHDDTWYVVLSAVGEIDTVTISAGVDFTVPSTTTGDTFTGEGDKTTATFTSIGIVKINWITTYNSPDFALFSVFIYEQGDTVYQDSFDGLDGTTYYYDSGTLYFKVIAANLNSWTITTSNTDGEYGTSFSGSGDKNIKLFKSSGNVKITWTSSYDDEAYALLSAYVYELGQSIFESTFAGLSGETFLYQEGTFYFAIIAANLNSWTITVEDMGGTTTTTTTNTTTTTTSQESDITTTTTTTTSSDAPGVTSVEFIVVPIALTSLALILIRRKKHKN